MDQASIKNQLKQIIAHELDANIPLESIHDNSSLYEEGLALDSISIVNLIVLVEEKFGISLEDNEVNLATFSSVNSLAELLEKKLTVNHS